MVRRLKTVSYNFISQPSSSSISIIFLGCYFLGLKISNRDQLDVSHKQGIKRKALNPFPD